MLYVRETSVLMKMLHDVRYKGSTPYPIAFAYWCSGRIQHGNSTKPLVTHKSRLWVQTPGAAASILSTGGSRLPQKTYYTQLLGMSHGGVLDIKVLLLIQ
jgi:hypothetical protein